jgi:hypothetical protein
LTFICVITSRIDVILNINLINTVDNYMPSVMLSVSL